MQMLIHTPKKYIPKKTNLIHLRFFFALLGHKLVAHSFSRSVTATAHQHTYTSSMPAPTAPTTRMGCVLNLFFRGRAHTVVALQMLRCSMLLCFAWLELPFIFYLSCFVAVAVVAVVVLLMHVLIFLGQANEGQHQRQKICV